MGKIEARERAYVTPSTCEVLPDVGRKLREMREAANLSLSDLGEQIHFQGNDWLNALEEGRMSDVLNGTEGTIRGLIKKYARRAKVDPRAVLDLYEKQRLGER
jgi:cytoskeletal protein RodZ